MGQPEAIMASHAGSQAVDGVRLGMEMEGLRRRPGALRGLLHFARRRPLGALSIAVISTLIVVAVFAPLLAPYDPIETHPREKLLGPGESGYVLGTDEFGRD